MFQVTPFTNSTTDMPCTRSRTGWRIWPRRLWTTHEILNNLFTCLSWTTTGFYSIRKSFLSPVIYHVCAQWKRFFSLLTRLVHTTPYTNITFSILNYTGNYLPYLNLPISCSLSSVGFFYRTRLRKLSSTCLVNTEFVYLLPSFTPHFHPFQPST